MHEDLVRLIERARVAFPRPGSGVTTAAIARAEASLGLPLPESYKWWLLTYGGGQIKGDIVYGLEEEQPDDTWLPDIVALAEVNRRDPSHPRERLVFCTGNEESFFFDTTQMVGGEYPVFYYEADRDEATHYASSFVEFLHKRIRELYGISD